MRTAVFSTRSFDRPALERANESAGHDLRFLDASLSSETTRLVEDEEAVCLFVSDEAPAGVVEDLADRGVRLIVLRSAGFNHVDVEAAEQHGLTILRVPAYSPHAVAEHTVGLMLALNRKYHRAYLRVREQNFSLGGLLGFDMHAKTVGIVGTGKIGRCTARILAGFGCRLLGYDVVESDEAREIGVEYVELDRLWRESDIVTLHCPLNPDTHHLVDADALGAMKRGVMLINTSRGAVIDTRAAIDALKSGHLGLLGLDVYEEESDLFFRDLSDRIITDDLFVRLVTFPNVLVTAHQAFFTREALENIAETTIGNLSDFESGETKPDNRVTSELLRG